MYVKAGKTKATTMSFLTFHSSLELILCTLTPSLNQAAVWAWCIKDIMVTLQGCTLFVQNQKFS